VGLSAVASGVKFRPGPSSALGEKVASGLVWRFGTFDCVSDNLAHFENGFGNSGSFLDVGSHRFYVAKPFPEEVTDIFDSLCEGGSSYGESSNLGTMVEVMALGEDEGGDLPCPERPSLKRPPPQEQDTPLSERDAPDISVVNLRVPLDRIIDPARVAEALERTRLVLLGCPRSAPPSRISQLGCPWRSSTSRLSNLRRNPYPSTCLEIQPRLRYRHRTRGLPSRG
jgi:hypothetical protein